MWIDERNGKFLFRERYVDRCGRRRTVTVTMANKTRPTAKKAQAMLADIIRRKLEPPEATMTLRSILDDYVKHKSLSVKPLTLIHYSLYSRRIFEALEPERNAAGITAREWQRFFDGLSLSTSPRSAKDTFLFAKAAMERAERLDGINALALRRVRIELPAKTKAAVATAAAKFLSRSELSEVLAALREQSPYIADICEFQSRTGLRYGELTALREDDVDLQRRLIHVTGTLVFNVPGERGHRDTPKNVYSIRDVTLDQRATEIIRKFMTRNKLARAWGSRSGDKLPDRYIFTSERDGYPLDISYVNRLLRSLQHPKHLTTHIFRHTHISLLAEEGVPLKAIMARVGHNEPRTTMAVYTHVSNKMQQEVMNALERISI